MSYLIFDNVIDSALQQRLLDYSTKKTDTTIQVQTDELDSPMYGTSILKPTKGNMCRKHTSTMVHGNLRDEFEAQFLANVDLSKLSITISNPTLGPDVIINTYHPGDFILTHTDPPFTMWGPDRLIRQANFSCMLSNNYTGGELQVVNTIVPKLNERSTVIFEQPQQHTVHLVRTGVRVVVFGWVYSHGVVADAS